MRHRKRGRKLNRSSAHRQALLRNLAGGLLRTLDAEDDDTAKPKVPGRIVTTLAKAKEVRPFLERLITLARRAMIHEEEAAEWGTDAPRHSPDWENWRRSERWQRWSQTRAPAVTARRHALRLLGDKDAVRILFDTVAARFEDRPGGYTRIIRRSQRRLGDASPTVILELVGERDRQPTRRERPVIEKEEPSSAPDEPAAAKELQTQTAGPEEETAAPAEKPKKKAKKT